MRRSAALLLLMLVVLVAGCGDDGGSYDVASPPQANGVEELSNILDLRAAFEADAGKPRVIVLFSPT
jgi:hypothetical protein